MSEQEDVRERRMWRQTVHLFGFIGDPQDAIRASWHEGAVADVARAVMADQERHGYTPVLKSRTSTLDGWPVVLHYEVPNKPPHEDMPMWHVFRRPDEPWPTAAPSTTDPATQEAAHG